MTDKKTLSTFVATLKDFVLDGSTDYNRIDQMATQYFGHRIPNAQIWKVHGHLRKQVAEVEDDL